MGEGFPRSLILSVLVLSFLGMAVACKTGPTAEAPVTTPPAFESKPSQQAEKVDEAAGFREAEPEAEPVRESASSLAEKLNTQGVLKPIHFDFDKYDLRSDAVRTLGDNAGRIKEHNQFKVRIEGHCD